MQKNRFSEVVDRAIEQGPQEITRHGKKAVFVISAAEYKRIRQKKTDLCSFFKNSPLADIDLSRSQEKSRKIDL